MTFLKKKGATRLLKTSYEIFRVVDGRSFTSSGWNGSRWVERGNLRGGFWEVGENEGWKLCFDMKIIEWRVQLCWGYVDVEFRNQGFRNLPLATWIFKIIAIFWKFFEFLFYEVVLGGCLSSFNYFLEVLKIIIFDQNLCKTDFQPFWCSGETSCIKFQHFHSDNESIIFLESEISKFH